MCGDLCQLQRGNRTVDEDREMQLNLFACGECGAFLPLVAGLWYGKPRIACRASCDLRRFTVPEVFCFEQIVCAGHSREARMFKTVGGDASAHPQPGGESVRSPEPVIGKPARLGPPSGYFACGPDAKHLACQHHTQRTSELLDGQQAQCVA